MGHPIGRKWTCFSHIDSGDSTGWQQGQWTRKEDAPALHPVAVGSHCIFRYGRAGGYTCVITSVHRIDGGDYSYNIKWDDGDCKNTENRAQADMLQLEPWSLCNLPQSIDGILGTVLTAIGKHASFFDDEVQGNEPRESFCSRLAAETLGKLTGYTADMEPYELIDKEDVSILECMRWACPPLYRLLLTGGDVLEEYLRPLVAAWAQKLAAVFLFPGQVAHAPFTFRSREYTESSPSDLRYVVDHGARNLSREVRQFLLDLAETRLLRAVTREEEREACLILGPQFRYDRVRASMYGADVKNNTNALNAALAFPKAPMPNPVARHGAAPDDQYIGDLDTRFKCSD